MFQKYYDLINTYSTKEFPCFYQKINYIKNNILKVSK